LPKLARSEFVGSGPVQYRLEGPIEAPTKIEVRVDYTDAQTPRDYYVADYFYVENLDPTVLFVFGKRDSRTNKLRTKLEVFFPAMFFVNQLMASVKQFHEVLRGYVGQYGYDASKPGEKGLEADKTQTLHSNNVLAVLSGGDSLMDFYYLSPREMYYKPRNKREVELEPLARVIIDPPMLLGFLDECARISGPLVEKFQEAKHEHSLESN
jgi:hypothetical protein